MSTSTSEPGQGPGSWVWLARLARQPMRPVSFNPAAGGDRQLVGTSGILCGWELHEAAAQSITFQVFDGNDPNGRLLAEALVGASVNTLQAFAYPGVYFRSGLFFHLLAGTGLLRGSFHVKLFTR